MYLEEQTAEFYFGRGLSLKDDPFKIPAGKFVSLENCVFDTLTLLKKRNGFGTLTSTLGSVSYLTTYQNNLIGLGSHIQSYSNALNTFIDKGKFPQVALSVQPLSNLVFGQNYCDLAISNNGLICQVTGEPVGNIFPTTWSWTILEQATGQVIAGPINTVGSGGAQNGQPRVWCVGSQFVIVYQAANSAQINGSASWLEYITIPTSNPMSQSQVFSISSNSLTPGAQNSSYLSFDGVVTSTSGLYLAWENNAQNLAFSTILNPVTNTNSGIVSFGSTALVQSIDVCADFTQSPPTIWNALVKNSFGTVGFYALTPSGSVIGNTGFVSCSGSVVITSSSFVINNVAMTAQNGSMTAYIENVNNYGYDTTIPTNVICKMAVNQGVTAGSIACQSTSVVIARGLGLGSKGFIFNSTSYVLSQYLSPYQSTYFLINSTGQVQAKLGYGNANNNSYSIYGLPSVSVIGSSAYVPYLFQTTVQDVNIAPTNNSTTTTQAIFSPLGVNMAEFNFMTPPSPPVQIGNTLLLGGGFLGSYDGYQFTENDFFLFPDSVEVNFHSQGSTTITPETFFYQAVYQWVDYQGNIYNSAPSIPVSITVNTSSGFFSISVPTLRISYKNYPYGGLNTPSQIILYRWSNINPIYYETANFIPTQTTSTSDYAVFLDTRTDSQVSGGQIIYTNGGVVEDVNGPATTAMTTFDSRLWLIDSEDQNLLWFSKQVIENTPVEMSDLFTFYVAPNIGAEGPTGNMKALAPMDDKLVIFKSSALYYINGIGPDNTGANNQYSQPIFISSAVGCSNPNSIVLIDKGLMFQSNKGIWLLGRDLSTNYIGKDVEALANNAVVLSAITIPNTNQVRFTLSTGITLVYDYFVNEWGTFNGIPNIASTLYQGLHTFVNSSSSVFQETPGIYQDGQIPTLMSFQTGWLSLSGLQGYVRAYKSYLLGTYYSPHNFSMGIAYDYNQSILQTILVNPTNTTGSGSQVEQWELNFQKQQCQSFQLTFNEISSQSAGQGLTISGLDLVYGAKAGYPRNLPSTNRTS